MSKYRVWFSFDRHFYYDVEADDEEKAQKQAEKRFYKGDEKGDGEGEGYGLECFEVQKMSGKIYIRN